MKPEEKMTLIKAHFRAIRHILDPDCRKLLSGREKGLMQGLDHLESKSICMVTGRLRGY